MSILQCKKNYEVDSNLKYKFILKVENIFATKSFFTFIVMTSCYLLMKYM